MPTQLPAQILTDPGYLLYAPIGTSIPTHTVVGSKFTDAWPAGWVVFGPTEDGSEISYQMKLEAIYVAEVFDPIVWAPTERSGSIAMALANWTLTNLAQAFATANPTIVSGTGTTQLNKLSAPDPTAIVRKMIGWESLDNTLRAVMYQTINGAEIKMGNKRAPNLGTIPVEFNFEKPSATAAIDFWSAGTARG